MSQEITEPTALRQLLERSTTIAVLGAHIRRERAAFYVPEYLAAAGYRVFAVNPRFVGQKLWGEPVFSTLNELPPDVPIDIVNVFRPSTALDNHLQDILAMEPAPRAVWLQLGIYNAAFAARLIEVGLDVVQDRCTLSDHRRFRIPSKA